MFTKHSAQLLHHDAVLEVLSGLHALVQSKNRTAESDHIVSRESTSAALYGKYMLICRQSV